MTVLRALRTTRLVLTPIAPGDVVDVAEIGAQPEVAAMTISVPQPMTVGVAGDWIARQRLAIDAGTAATYAAKLDLDRRMVGVVSLHHVDRDHACAELSFWFSSQARGRGYASEAAGVLTRYGFAELGLHRIEAYHMVRNRPCERVLGRVGFRLEGVLRERIAKGGRREDAKLWSLLSTDALSTPTYEFAIGDVYARCRTS